MTTNTTGKKKVNGNSATKQMEIICPLCGEKQPSVEEGKKHLIEVHKLKESMIGDLEPVNKVNSSDKEINIKGGLNQKIEMADNNVNVPLTPEEEAMSKKRVADEVKRQLAMNSPSITYDVDKQVDSKGKSFKGGNATALVTALAVSVFVVLIAGMMWLNPGYNKSINAVAAQLTKSIADLKTANTTANSSTAGNVNSMQSKYDGEISTMQNDIAGIKSANQTLLDTVNSVKTIAQSGLDTAKAAQSTANGISQSSVTSAIDSATATITSSQTADEATIKTNGADIATLKTQLAADELIIKNLQSNGTGTGTGTGTGVTGTNGVNAVIPPTLIGTAQSVSFNTITQASPSNSETSPFSFTLVNTTGAVANNIQLGIILQTVQGANTSNPTVIDLTDPKYAATVSVNISGYLTTWTSQSTGQAGVLAFVNNVPTGLLAGLGTLSQGAGTSNPFTVNITVTVNQTAMTSIVPNFTVIPIVKVIGFTK